MKKRFFVAIFISALLVSCSLKSNAISGTSSNSNNGSGAFPGGSITTSAPEAIEDDDCPIQSVTLEPKEVMVQVGKKSDSIIVNFTPNTLDLDTKQGIWSVSDTSIATIDQYGRVTGVSKGKTVATFTTNVGSRRANCLVYVYNSGETVTKEYRKVDDMNSISGGDTVVFACPEAGITASKNRVDGYLSLVVSTFSGDKNKITNLGVGTAEFLVGEGNEGGLTLEADIDGTSKYLCAKYLKNITFVPKHGAIDWSFEHTSFEDGSSEGNYVYSVYDSIEGWLMFNAKANRFTLYDSSVQVDMFLPTIYRLTTIYN